MQESNSFSKSKSRHGNVSVVSLLRLFLVKETHAIDKEDLLESLPLPLRDENDAVSTLKYNDEIHPGYLLLPRHYYFCWA